MEKTIYNGVKAIVLDASQLYCIRHISQRDEKKLDKLLNKQKSTSSQRSSSKITILKDIFGESKGSVYDYGLAETHDFGNFSAKLISLKENGKTFVQGFINGFRVISSSRERTNLSGLFYQNYIEFVHHIKKFRQCFTKRSIVEVTQILRDLSLRQENDEIRAIYGAGKYALLMKYSNFKVDSAR